ncbi:MAG: oligosaccharide flippase family protein [Candidatus Aenigmarchaeota archaeon]|nr:oligosaccharide flippase family protein [Candidatus Aenigmarchaeota archaeon]
MKEEKKLFSNAFYLFLDLFFINLFSLFYVLTIWKFLPPEDYGVIATTTNFSLLFSNICFLGFGTANPKLISEYYQKKQVEKIGALLRFSFLVSSTFFLIFSAITTFLYLNFIASFKLPLDSFLLALISIFFIIAYGISGSVLYGLQNMKKYFISEFVSYFVKFILAFLLLFLGFGYLGALISFTLSYLIGFLARLEKKWFSISNNLNKKFILSNYALPAFFMSIFSLFINNSQYVILTFIQNPEVTGIFGTALTASFVITLIPNILSASLFPIISQLSVVKGKEQKQSYLASIVTRYILLFSFPSILFFSIFSGELIMFFAGESYLPSSQFLPVLTLASFFFGLGNYFLSCLYGIRRTTLTRNISLSFTFLFLLLALPLTYFFSSFGLSLAYFVSMLLYFFTGLIFMKKYLQLKALAKPLAKILLVSAIFGLLLLTSEIFAFRFYFKILVLFLAGLIYFVLLIPLNFYQQEEIRILNYLGRRLPLFKSLFFKLANFLSKYTS